LEFARRHPGNKNLSLVSGPGHQLAADLRGHSGHNLLAGGQRNPARIKAQSRLNLTPIRSVHWSQDLKWISYRCHTAKGEECIPIFGPYGLVQQLGSVEYSRPRRFRVKLEQWLETIRTLWPDGSVAKSSGSG
jgi:hypothetical protein